MKDNLEGSRLEAVLQLLKENTSASISDIAEQFSVSQMTIRRDLQKQLVRDGYRVRVYIPFGREWFPYFMRRLGERPANVGFVLRGIFSESG